MGGGVGGVWSGGRFGNSLQINLYIKMLKTIIVMVQDHKVIKLVWIKSQSSLMNSDLNAASHGGGEPRRKALRLAWLRILDVESPNQR